MILQVLYFTFIAAISLRGNLHITWICKNGNVHLDVHRRPFFTQHDYWWVQYAFLLLSKKHKMKVRHFDFKNFDGEEKIATVNNVMSQSPTLWSSVHFFASSANVFHLIAKEAKFNRWIEGRWHNWLSQCPFIGNPCCLLLLDVVEKQKRIIEINLIIYNGCILVVFPQWLYSTRPSIIGFTECQAGVIPSFWLSSGQFSWRYFTTPSESPIYYIYSLNILPKILISVKILLQIPEGNEFECKTWIIIIDARVTQHMLCILYLRHRV